MEFINGLSLKLPDYELVFFRKRIIFAPLINRGRVPQNLITRLCQ